MHRCVQCVSYEGDRVGRGAGPVEPALFVRGNSRIQFSYTILVYNSRIQFSCRWEFSICILGSIVFRAFHAASHVHGVYVGTLQRAPYPPPLNQQLLNAHPPLTNPSTLAPFVYRRVRAYESTRNPAAEKTLSMYSACHTNPCNAGKIGAQSQRAPATHRGGDAHTASYIHTGGERRGAASWHTPAAACRRPVAAQRPHALLRMPAVYTQ